MVRLRGGIVVLIACLIISSSGCVVVRRIVSFIEVKKEMCATRADIYDAKTDLCLEQRRLQQDACAAQAQMEIEKCRAQFQQELAELRAGVELEKEEVRSQFRERLRSNLALNLDQHVDVGQLQVNTEELKKLIEERDKEHKEAAQIYERLENTRRAQMRENALTEAQKALDSNDVAKAQMIMRNCACGSFVANSDCSQPIADKLTQREAMKEPVKQPILPTEIPLMLPIKISVGMDNPSIQNARVQQLRVREPMKQCQACEQCVAFNPKCPTCNPAIAPVPPESEPAPVVVPPSPPK